VAGSEARVDEAGASYLPRLEVNLQLNRATRNNLAGTLFPQSVLPAITGPVPLSAEYAGVWGTAAGALLAWEPFDFGRRSAALDAARQGRREAGADLEATRLDVATATAKAYLDTVSAREVERAAQANVTRMEVFAQGVEALARSQLRPGVDLARAAAALASARSIKLRAQEAAAVAQARLSALLGSPGAQMALDPGPLLGGDPPSSLSGSATGPHPLVQARNAAQEAASFRARVSEQSYYPRFHLLAGVAGRGTGVNPNGDLPGGASGLVPDTFNWAAGVMVSFPVFDLFAARAQSRSEASRAAEEGARAQELSLRLRAAEEEALARLDAAQGITANAHVQRRAGQEAYTQTETRYRTGLTTVTDVADAAQVLVQGEIDVVVARVATWSALLALAQARGDLAPFLAGAAGERSHR
jgi:outer membrane protein TolC